MAIIAPTADFEGSSLEKSKSRYIVDNIARVDFMSREMKNGAYFYFLPAYKVDGSGRGAWYRVAKIRRDIGPNKRSYVVPASEAKDPFAMFERAMKQHYPDQAAVTEGVNDKGQKQKNYPLYGRTTNRVLFNVAFVEALEKGAHVLDVPSYGIADQIERWHKSLDARGNKRPLICDPTQATPVHIAMNLDASGQPWQISFAPESRSPIPEELADSGYLHNLDEVTITPSQDELLEMLSELYPADMINRLIGDMVHSGSPARSGGFTPSKPALPAPQQQLPAPVRSAVIPKMTIAKPTRPAAAVVPPVPDSPGFEDGTDLDGGPDGPVHQVQAPFDSNPADEPPPPPVAGPRTPLTPAAAASKFRRPATT